MGYTHYWTQTRSFTAEEWSEVSTDIGEILSYVENLLGVPLADAGGEFATRPIFGVNSIMFNGVGDDAHETFAIQRNRRKEWEGGSMGGDFTKTARKPYDVAVTACLCYLSSVTGTHSVSSDGSGADFLAGLNAARQAVPRKANVLDIPMDVMREDRWTGPWINGTGKSYEVKFCIDGKGYVYKRSSKEWYCFPTHEAMGRFLTASRQATFRKGGDMHWGGGYGKVEPDIWSATGCFDSARHKRIAVAQAKVLARLFPVDPDFAQAPPAFARPGEMPQPDTFCYSLSDLINKCDKLAA